MAKDKRGRTAAMSAVQDAAGQVDTKQRQQGKKLFWAAAVVIIGLIAVFCNQDVFSKGVLTSGVELIDPLNYYQSGGSSYIINSTGLEIMVLEDDQYCYSLDGGLIEDGFYYARDIKTDEQGYIYILDKQLNENGKSVDAERILRYDPKGNFERIVYSYAHEDGSSVLQLYNLTVADGVVRFVCTSPEETFSVCSVDVNTGEQVDVRDYAYENIYEIAWDFAFDEAGDVYVSSKTGVIEKLDAETGAKTVLYDGSAQQAEYFSIPTSIEYAADGSVYFNDIGHRKIQKLLPDGSIQTVVDIAEPIEEPPEAFSDKPIYSGLFVSDDLKVATFYSHSYYLGSEDGEGEQVYEYKLLVKDGDGQHLLNGSTFEKNSGLRVRGMVVAVLAAAAAVIGLILLVMAGVKISKANISSTVRTQIIIVFTAILATCISLFVIISETNELYYDEIMNNLENITLLMTQDIEEEVLLNVSTPGDFMNESYQNISDSVLGVLNHSINSERGIYCVIYKVQNDIVAAVYADDAMYGSGYPMPGSVEGSAEQYIYETGEHLTASSHSSSEGNFMLVLAPIFDRNDQVIGLMEIGTDLYSVNENTQKQVVDTILLVMTVVMVGVLLVSELIVIRANLKKRSRRLGKDMELDSSLIRPIVFLFFFIANMPTAFLPIFAKGLWDSGFPVPMEVASALPVSVELLIAAIVSMAFGGAVSKMGVKLMSLIGAVLFAGGNALCGFAPDLVTLIVGSALTGVGDGLIILAINSYIAGYEDDGQKNDGFMHYNAALLSGVNCGTVIGSAIAEQFGYQATYLAATVLCALMAVCCLAYIKNHKQVSEEDKQVKRENSLRFLMRPRVLKYFLLISVPYLICGAFMNYFFPIFGEENALTPTQISLAFLLMGIISIYFGPGLTKVLSERFTPKQEMLIATGLYAAALLIFIVRPEISSCYIAIALFAFADSFGFTAQSVYYATLPETVAVGEGPAMGINSGFESAASTAGPLVFGAALMLGQTAGITMIAVGFIALALLFVLTSFRFGKGNDV